MRISGKRNIVELAQIPTKPTGDLKTDNKSFVPSNDYADPEIKKSQSVCRRPARAKRIVINGKNEGQETVPTPHLAEPELEGT